MRLFPWSQAVSFDPSSWFKPESVDQQLKYIDAAVKLFKPHALIAHQLTVSAFFAARKYQLPLTIIGFAAPVIPVSAEHITDKTYRSNRLLKRRFEQVQAIFSEVADALQLPPIGDLVNGQPFLGDVHLLRTVPAFEQSASLMPQQVQMVGSLQWEPQRVDLRLTAFLLQARRDCANVLYVQLGRTFGEGTFLELIMGFLDTGARLVIDVLRADEIPNELKFSDNTYVDSYIPLNHALPHAKAVVANGHTSVVVGALSHDCPLVLFPNGSGTEDISERCEKAGAAIVLDSTSTTKRDVQRAIHEVIASPQIRLAAKKMGYAFRQADSVDFVPAMVEKLQQTELLMKGQMS